MIWSFASEEAETARSVRSQFMAYLRECAEPGGDFGAAELIFAELVGNVALHAPGSIIVDLQWLDYRPFLTVCDTGPGFELPPIPALPEDSSESGRGLYLVWKLAGNLKVYRTPAGSHCVTTSLPLRRARTT